MLLSHLVRMLYNRMLNICMTIGLVTTMNKANVNKLQDLIDVRNGVKWVHTYLIYIFKILYTYVYCVLYKNYV